jgi:hypothetical protein
MKKTPWPESTNELYRPSDRHLSVKLVPTFADRGCHVVSVTDSYGHIKKLINLELTKLKWLYNTWGEVRLSAIGSSTTDGNIARAPDNGWAWSSQCSEN